jgi:diguanylate cyclase (GGDEF)-like protein
MFVDAVNVEKSLLDQRLKTADASDRELEWVLLGGTVLEAILAVFFGALISATFGGALSRLAHAARRLAEGNLDDRIPADGRDEIAQTAKAFNGMAGQIETLVADLREQVDQRGQAETALHSTNQQLTEWVAELEQRDQEAMLLAQTGELLQACETPAEGYTVLGSMLPRFVAVEPLEVFVINASQNLVERVAASAEGLQRAAVFRPDECWALRLGRPHQSSAAATDVACAHLGQPRPPFSLCVPMVAHGRSLGVIHLELEEFPGERTLRARSRLLGSLADQVGLALANLSLRETLRTQALRDPLTGLFNRRYLEESMDREISRATRSRVPFSVLMLDIDKFKVLNDTYGHQTGDEVLKQVARVLMREIRSGDLACRYGGEEFTVILPEAAPENAFKRADRIRAAIAELPVAPGQSAGGGVTVSFGVAGFPEHGATAPELLRAADAALYRAKHNGRNRVEMAEPLAAESTAG